MFVIQSTYRMLFCCMLFFLFFELRSSYSATVWLLQLLLNTLSRVWRTSCVCCVLYMHRCVNGDVCNLNGNIPGYRALSGGYGFPFWWHHRQAVCSYAWRRRCKRRLAFFRISIGPSLIWGKVSQKDFASSSIQKSF